MRNTYSSWGELKTEFPDVEVRMEDPGHGLLGEYRHHERAILLKPNMPRRQMRSVLAHELEHAAAGDCPSDSPGITLRQEFLADTRSSRKLIDVRDLADAMVIHDQNPSAVSVEINVSLAVVQCRLKHLRSREWEYLRRRFGS